MMFCRGIKAGRITVTAVFSPSGLLSSLLQDDLEKPPALLFSMTKQT